ncbi:hypothetical protein PRIPAC_84260 [Pristionchus pacificus]|uniref:Uncharacterized protein n=1 Tax=Pristionchus pacificus TaxID=54126 RepID=A0A2A6BL89_PRIPA|nr:hypothetical protein PRIPAC_84260 [Pristionchus pacificus]|eukprot:PDM66551.1 hypothetical protein PRIPAC_47968 [Pristionchus pacificus]
MEGFANRPTKRREVITIESDDDDDRPAAGQQPAEKRVKTDEESSPDTPPASPRPLGTPLSAQEADALREQLSKAERLFARSRRSARIAELRAENLEDILEKKGDIITAAKKEEDLVKKLDDVSKQLEEAKWNVEESRKKEIELIEEKHEWAQEKEQWDREREGLIKEQDKLKTAYDELKSKAQAKDWEDAMEKENAECAAEMAKLIPLYDALKSEAEMNDWKAHMREFKKKRAQWGREKEELREETEELRKENDKLKAKKMENEREREAWIRETEELRAANERSEAQLKEKENQWTKEKEEWTQRVDRLTTSNAQLQRREANATEQMGKLLLNEVDGLKRAKAQGGGSGGGVSSRPDGPPSNVALSESQRANEVLKKSNSSLRRREKELEEKLKEMEEKAKIKLAQPAAQSVLCRCQELNERATMPLDQAIAEISTRYEEWKLNGRAFRRGQDFKNKALKCDACVEMVDKLDVLDTSSARNTLTGPMRRHHIDQITRKARSMCNLMLRSFLTTSSDVLLKAYKIYIRPLLESSTVIWNPTAIGLVNKLESVQREFTRRIFWRSLLSQSSYPQRLEHFKLETLEYRRALNDIYFLFDSAHGFVHLDTSNIYSIAPLSRTLRSSHRLRLTIPFLMPSSLSSFATRPLTLWNSLSNPIVTLPRIPYRNHIRRTPSLVLPVSQIKL